MFTIAHAKQTFWVKCEIQFFSYKIIDLSLWTNANSHIKPGDLFRTSNMKVFYTLPSTETVSI